MNSKLNGRVFDVPQNILDKMRHTISGLNGKNVHGIKRAERILTDKKVSYAQLKRIIHDLENMDAVNEKVRYDLYGGDLMKEWSGKFLNGERELIRDKNSASASINNNTGLERKNPFLKKHTKKPKGINLGIKSNSVKSAITPIASLGLFEEIKRFKQIINY